MGSKHNIHDPGDDHYYYCPNHDCPCHDDDLNDHPASNVVNVNFGARPDRCSCPICACGCPTCTPLHDTCDCPDCPVRHQYTTTDSFEYLRARANHPANHRPGV